MNLSELCPSLEMNDCFRIKRKRKRGQDRGLTVLFCLLESFRVDRSVLCSSSFHTYTQTDSTGSSRWLEEMLQKLLIISKIMFHFGEVEFFTSATFEYIQDISASSFKVRSCIECFGDENLT